MHRRQNPIQGSFPGFFFVHYRLFFEYLCVKQQSCAGALTSMRWELTFLPFLFQLTFGLGSPAAWHTNETTPPETPIWSTGTLVNRGGTGERTDKEEDIRTYSKSKRLQRLCGGALRSRRPAVLTGSGLTITRLQAAPILQTPGADVPGSRAVGAGRWGLIYGTWCFYLSGNPSERRGIWDYHLQLRLRTKGMLKTRLPGTWIQPIWEEITEKSGVQSSTTHKSLWPLSEIDPWCRLPAAWVLIGRLDVSGTL